MTAPQLVSATDTANIRILLVEDNEYDAHSFRRALRKSQIKADITIRIRAEEALQTLQAEEQSFDLIVSDYRLPGMTGLELYKRLREQAINLPLVMLTGTGNEHLAVEALKAGVNDYLIKDPEEGYLDLLGVVLPQVIQQYRSEIARIRAEQALQQSEARYRAIVEDQTELVCRFLADGSLTFANGAYTRNFGDIVAKWSRRFVLFESEDAEKARLYLQTLDETNPVITHEHHLVMPNGEFRWLQWTSRAIFNERGKLTEYQTVGRDITERKRVEDALRQYADELHARNEELDAFAHTVAHDLLSPLGLVIGYAEFLEDTFDGLSADDLRQYLNNIVQSGYKMTNIIEALLLLAGVRKLVVELEPLDMGQIVTEAQKRLVRLTNEVQGEIILPESWPVAMGFAPWIEEIWANYLSNGLKYGGRPPRLELGADVLENNMICFWVHDNGVGLSPEEQEGLFTPFTQRERKHSEGYGLGLSIVRRIVEKLGGEAGVKSTAVPGEGCIFYFSLPLHNDS
ncbi:MAG: response regulator [Chloroflexota bacterium]